jgi:hypothetical protein
MVLTMVKSLLNLSLKLAKLSTFASSLGTKKIVLANRKQKKLKEEDGTLKVLSSYPIENRKHNTCASIESFMIEKYRLVGRRSLPPVSDILVCLEDIF